METTRNFWNLNGFDGIVMTYLPKILEKPSFSRKNGKIYIQKICIRHTRKKKNQL
jgi:hypothetical protein